MQAKPDGGTALNMYRQEIVDAILVFKPEIANRIAKNWSWVNDAEQISYVCRYLFANQITTPEEPISVIRRAAMLIEQQGSEFKLDEADDVQAQIDTLAAKKAKNKAAYLKAITTPVMSEEDKTFAMRRKLRLGVSTARMMDFVAPWPHKPYLWGAIWDNVPSTMRTVATMIKFGVLEVVEYHKDPLYAIIQRGPRWDEAAELYKPSENYRRVAGMSPPEGWDSSK